MILAFDAHYDPARSCLAAAGIADWAAAEINHVRRWEFGPAADYQPGSFYLRELPLLAAALVDYGLQVNSDRAAVRSRGGPPPGAPVVPSPTAIIIDGYVTLNAEGRPGLGKYLYGALGGSVPVVGVAKNYFRDTHAERVLRGGSSKPLFVTALGMDAAEAAGCIHKLAGPYRIPELLKTADQLARRG